LFLLNTFHVHHSHAKEATWWKTIYHFYNIPYTKFWSSTLAYIAYLVLLGYVLVFEGGAQIAVVEYFLWFWMFSYFVEELTQLQRDKWEYFSHLSNKMDILIMILQFMYIGFSLAASVTPSPVFLDGSIYSLIIVTIISFVRLLDVFTMNKNLGPLYFVLQKVVRDVVKWAFVFMLFAIGFQLSFMGIMNHLHGNIWDPSWSSDQNGVFMGAFYTIIGDWSGTMGAIQGNNFGVILVSLYALIAQILLVNLLIAMMGDTFNTVNENSDKEWKFSRYKFTGSYRASSPIPPPASVVVMVFEKLQSGCSALISKINNWQVELNSSENQVLLQENQRTLSNSEFPAETSTKNSELKNFMRSTKESFLENGEHITNTIDTLHNLVRDSFKDQSTEQDKKLAAVTESLKRELMAMSKNTDKTLLSMDKTLASMEKALALDRNELNTTINIAWASGVTKDQTSQFLQEFKTWAATQNPERFAIQTHTRGVIDFEVMDFKSEKSKAT